MVTVVGVFLFFLLLFFLVVVLDDICFRELIGGCWGVLNARG